MKPTFYFLILFSSILLQSCFLKPVSKAKDLTYIPADDKLKTDEMKLDVYSPKNIKDKKNVFIFLHGGAWTRGSKSLYKFFGKRLARKNITAVIVDYPLTPKADYKDMAIASAKAVKWVKENIDKYGGDPNRIFISGHSAGGHLAALITVKNEYFESLGIKNPLKGAVLIDAAGLDINNYLMEREAAGAIPYIGTFTLDHAKWKDASPIYYLHKGMPPMLIFRGGKTYPDIKNSNERFVTELSKYAPVNYKVIKRRHHIPMIFQFYNSCNPLYKTMITFMEEQK